MFTPSEAQEAINLDGAWELRCVEASLSTPSDIVDRVFHATVPGQVHTDLIAINVLRDPVVGLRENEQRWIGDSSWEYRRTFTIDRNLPGEHVELVADGLDTFAEVFVNGTEVGRGVDQHIQYRWDVREHLREGDNEIVVRFQPAAREAVAREQATGPLPAPYVALYPHVRKSACNFGWDWGPEFVTAGIWQSIRIESYDVRIAATRVHPVAVAEHQAVVDLVADLTGETEGASVRYTVLDPTDREVCVVHRAAEEPGASVVLESPSLWWPVGYGDQPLYAVRTEVISGDHVVATAEKRFGVRSVSIDTSVSDDAEQWQIVVNGRTIWARGYNWIPDRPFIADATPDAAATRLRQAVDGGANIVRIWGGGYFVPDSFLDVCDELGIMVWHDFLFACAAYDESTEMLDLVETEARQALARMNSHPSLVAWCGGNECVWGWHSWGWPDIVGDRSWGAKIYTELLPRLVEEIDPTRIYLPNSPWSGSLDEHPNSREHGPVHLWEVWNDLDFSHYRKEDPAFVSEMGWCGPASWTTLSDVVESGALLPDNPEVAFHMRAANGMHKLAKGMQTHFAETQRPELWHYRAQLTQARAEITGVEWLRSRARCAGVIVWQLNDCWPVMSWSAVDSAGIEKPLWFALRNSYASRFMTIQPTTPGTPLRPAGDGEVEIIVANDGPIPWAEDLRLRRVNEHGDVRAEWVYSLSLESGQREVISIPAELAHPDDETTDLLLLDADSRRVVWAWRPDRELKLPSAAVEATCSVQDGEIVVSATAASVVRDLTLVADRAARAVGIDASAVVVSDALRTLLPGETFDFIVRRRDGGAFDENLNLDGFLGTYGLVAANSTEVS